MKKILLVDDSADVLQVMKIYLEMENYVVKASTNACFIHKEIGEFKPDLLIMDIYLEGLDGREICKNLRQHPETNNFPILLTSTVPATLVEYKSYLADNYLEKPFDLCVLHQKIESLLDHASV